MDNEIPGYPDLRLVYSDFHRENGQPFSCEDEERPFRLTIHTTPGEFMAIAARHFYGDKPKFTLAGPNVETLEAYVADEHVVRKGHHYEITGPDGVVLSSSDV